MNVETEIKKLNIKHHRLMLQYLELDRKMTKIVKDIAILERYR